MSFFIFSPELTSLSLAIIFSDLVSLNHRIAHKASQLLSFSLSMPSSLWYRLKVCAVLLVSLLLMAGSGTCGKDKCTIGDDKASLIYVVKDAKKEPKGMS
jgi:hypothetical protein